MPLTDFRILVVHEDPSARDALVATLRRARDFRADVSGVATGAEALERVDREPVHLVLSEERLADMTGVDLLARVRDARPTVVRALLARSADAEVAMQAVEKARVHYLLRKPWEPEDLRLTVAEALRGAWRTKL